MQDSTIGKECHVISDFISKLSWSRTPVIEAAIVKIGLQLNDHPPYAPDLIPHCFKNKKNTCHKWSSTALPPSFLFVSSFHLPFSLLDISVLSLSESVWVFCVRLLVGHVHIELPILLYIISYYIIPYPFPSKFSSRVSPKIHFA